VNAEPEGFFTVLDSNRFPRPALFRLADTRLPWLAAAAALLAVPVGVPVGLATATADYVLVEWLAAAAVLLLVGWLGTVGLRRRLAPHRRTLETTYSRAVWRRAVAARNVVVTSWPKLRRHAEVGADAPAVVNRAMWELAGVLLERDRIEAAREDLLAARRELARNDPVNRELSTRIDGLLAARNELNADISGRVGHLTSLAESCTGFLAEQAAIAHARDAARAADAILGGRVGDDDDPGRDLAERTSAVLDAYRELQRQVGGPVI